MITVAETGANKSDTDLVDSTSPNVSPDFDVGADVGKLHRTTSPSDDRRNR